MISTLQALVERNSLVVSPLSTLVAADVLEDGLSRLARVVRVPMPHAVARLDPPTRPGDRPTLYLDVDSPPEWLCWAMADALLELSTPGSGQHARDVRRLRSIS